MTLNVKIIKCSGYEFLFINNQFRYSFEIIDKRTLFNEINDYCETNPICHPLIISGVEYEEYFCKDWDNVVSIDKKCHELGTELNFEDIKDKVRRIEYGR